MPRYEYRCQATGQVVAVEHDASQVLRTWGELCTVAALPTGATDPTTPVTRLLSASFAGLISEGPVCIGGVCSIAPGAENQPE